MLLVAALAAAAWFYPEKFLCVESGAAKADAIVVLGGGHDRPQRAAELYKSQVAPRIIVSGYGDAEIVRRELISFGVPAKAIELEDKSKTTKENAVFTAKLLRAEKAKRVVIVTSWYHSRRALNTFEHYASGIKFYSRPSYFAFKRSDWPKGFSRKVYWEFAKIPGYWVRYGVWPF